MNFKDNLKKIRKDNNLSQEDLAEKLNVSRQSVSKWESGLAYPEMDKVIQICKMFNLNIDELLNQDIKEVNNSKQSKTNYNKYIESILSFITKTVDMFTSMKFKQIIGCIFEQAIIIFVFYFVFSIFREVLGGLFQGLFGSFEFGYKIINVLFSIYNVIAFILGFILLLYIFKTRYLDYYKVVYNNQENSEENSKEKNEDNNEEVLLKKKEEKIIIRDPKHSEYRFISGLLKVIMFFIKAFVLFISIFFCMSFVFFTLSIVISFVFVKTGLLFVGAFLGLLACLTINFIILYLMFCFIANKYPKKGLMGILFISSLLVGGISIGLILIGLKDFKIINEFDSKYMTKTEEIIKIDDTTFISDYYGSRKIEYIETDSKEVKIVYEHVPYCKIVSHYGDDSNYYYINCATDENKLIEEVIKMINKKVFINPDLISVKVYASKENIKKLKDNEEKFYKKQTESCINNEIEDLNETIDILNKRIKELESNN